MMSPHKTHTHLTNTHTHTCRSLHLQLHHGVLAQLVPTRRCHLINPDQLGLVAYAISTETLNKPRLAAVLTCGGGGKKRERERTGNKSGQMKESVYRKQGRAGASESGDFSIMPCLVYRGYGVCVYVCVCLLRVSACLFWLLHKYLWNKKYRLNNKLAAASETGGKLNLRLKKRS